MPSEIAGPTIASGSLPSYSFHSVRCGVEVLHRITVTGPINLARRLPLYDATLAVNPSTSYFCILDNRGGFDNDLGYADMKVLDQRLVEAGIRTFYGVTVTSDAVYDRIVEIANVNMRVTGLEGKVHVTNDMDDAERFIAEMLRASGAVPNAGQGQN